MHNDAVVIVFVMSVTCAAACIGVHTAGSGRPGGFAPHTGTIGGEPEAQVDDNSMQSVRRRNRHKANSMPCAMCGC